MEAALQEDGLRYRSQILDYDFVFMPGEECAPGYDHKECHIFIEHGIAPTSVVMPKWKNPPLPEIYVGKTKVRTLSSWSPVSTNDGKATTHRAFTEEKAGVPVELMYCVFAYDPSRDLFVRVTYGSEEDINALFEEWTNAKPQPSAEIVELVTVPAPTVAEETSPEGRIERDVTEPEVSSCACHSEESTEESMNNGCACTDCKCIRDLKAADEATEQPEEEMAPVEETPQEPIQFGLFSTLSTQDEPVDNKPEQDVPVGGQYSLFG